MSFSSLEDFEVKSNSIILVEEKIEVKNYDEIKEKTKLITMNSISMKNINKIFDDKKFDNNNLSNLKKKKSLVKTDWNTIHFQKEIEFKNIEKINKIKFVSKKIPNLIYSKINILDFNHFNEDYYFENKFCLLNKEFKKFKNLNSDLILKSIYYEYHNKKSNINFFSNFELGNLDLVYKNFKKDNCYDLIISSDKNIELSTGWFYFKTKGLYKGQKIIINIKNLTRNYSLYNKKKIAIKSNIKINNKNENEKIVYDWKYWGENIKIKKSKNYNILSFEYTFRYDNEIVYFAENIPYDLQKNEKLINKLHTLINKKLNIKINTFYDTDINYNNYYINLTSNNNKVNKPIIILLSRIEPSHNSSSYILEGMIKYLIKNFNISNEFLLNNYEMIFVPFFSIEMVMFGNTKHTINGINLSNFQNNNIYKCKELNSLKKLLTLINKKNSEIDMILEIHDDPYKFDYYFQIYGDNENNSELNDYNNFLNIMDYNLNFLKRKETIILNKNEKYIYFRKNFNLKYLFKFYVSTFGNDNNDFEFMPSYWKEIGKNIIYNLSLFFAKTNKKAKGRENLNNIIYEIDNYFNNKDDKIYKLKWKNSIKINKRSNNYLKINIKQLIKKKSELKNKSKFIIKSEFQKKETKNYDYSIKKKIKSYKLNIKKKNNFKNKIKTKTEKSNLKASNNNKSNLLNLESWKVNKQKFINNSNSNNNIYYKIPFKKKLKQINSNLNNDFNKKNNNKKNYNSNNNNKKNLKLFFKKHIV